MVNQSQMFIRVNFKLVYSEITISINLPENIKIIDLPDYIKPYIERTYNINEFHISEAGTPKKESADPIELEDVKLFERYPKNFTSFYISKIRATAAQNQVPVILASTQECNICTSDIEPQNMFRMNCNHSCCMTCIYAWRIRGFNTCPFCRQII